MITLRGSALTFALAGLEAFLLVSGCSSQNAGSGRLDSDPGTSSGGDTTNGNGSVSANGSTSGSGGAGGQSPVYKYPDIGSFCTAVATEECSNAVVSACFDGAQSQLTAETLQCITARSSIGACNPLDLVYHPETAVACVAAYTAVYEASSWTRQALDSLASACIAVFSNSGPPGAVCSADTDCDTTQELHCVLRGSSGTCQMPVAGGDGAKCTDNPAVQCSDTEYCDPTAGACVGKKSAGDPCTPDTPCASDSQCLGGTCVPRGMDGDPCMADTDCVSCTNGTTGCETSFCVVAEGTTLGTCSSKLTLDMFSSDCDPFKGP